MCPVAAYVIYLNWYAIGMSGLLPHYQHFKVIIQNGFEHTDLITFPMWGYGWLMVITENKLGLLCIQMSLALLSLWYFIRLLEQEKIFAVSLIRVLKVCMVVSLPWYAFHALRWPYSIASSLFLLSIALLYKAIPDPEKNWLRLIGSALCFGLLLHFRSDYYLMPIGIAFLMITFFRSKRAVIQAGIWIVSIYACLIPWALYTKKACGHYLLTSTNSGHVLFVGFGNNPNNKWGITANDNDLLMHSLVNKHFKTDHHSTLDYEADQFLKKTFFSYLIAAPCEYIKKCLYVFKVCVFGGFYPGEYLLNGSTSFDHLKNNCIGYILFHALISLPFLIQYFPEIIRLTLHALSWFMGKYLLVLAYCLLPLILWHMCMRRASFFMVLIVAAVAYQTLINVMCFNYSAYLGNIYVLYLINVIYSFSLLYGWLKNRFMSRFYQTQSKRKCSVL